MMSKNILIVGSNSLIGMELKSLDWSGYNLFFTSRNLNDKSANKNIIQFDLKTNDTIDIDLEFEWCIYLADLPLIKGLMSSGLNIKKIIAFSTTSVLTKTDSVHEKDLNLVSRFISAEKYLKSSCLENNIGCYVFRPTLIYSIGHDKNVTVINKFVKKFKFFPKIGNLSGLRQPISSSCLAELVFKAVLQEPEQGSVIFFEVAGNETFTFKEMVERIFAYNNLYPLFIPLNKTLFRYTLKLLNSLGLFKNISFDMIDHASMDFNFDTKEVREKFNFKPKNFLENKCL